MIMYSYTALWIVCDEKLMVHQCIFNIEVNLGHKGIDKYIYVYIVLSIIFYKLAEFLCSLYLV